MNTPTPVAGAAKNLRELSVRAYSLDERRCIVVPAGAIDLASSPALKAALTELCELGYTQFVLDLSDVSHMDSTGLGVLVGLQNRLDESGWLRLAAVPPNVAKLLSMVGLDERLETFPNVDAALAETGRVERRSAVALDSHPSAPHPASPPTEQMAGGRTQTLPVDADAEIVLGLASTALPFAESTLAEAERWLRILRRYGDSGRILRETGVREAPIADLASREAGSARHLATGSAQSRLAAVGDQARRAAAERQADVVGTVDVLKAVVSLYGPDFERALADHGGKKAALDERLGIR